MVVTTWTQKVFVSDTVWSDNVLPECIFGYPYCDIDSDPLLQWCDMKEGGTPANGAVFWCDWGKNCTLWKEDAKVTDTVWTKVL